jgi:hypothetical protein
MSSHTIAPVVTPNVVIPSVAHGATAAVPYLGFVEGTMIACKVNGTEQTVAVQNLKPGMLVKTASGMFRPVDKVGTRSLNNPGTSERLANRLYTLAKAHYPSLTEDLTITGNRSTLIHSATDAQKRQMIAVHGRIMVADKRFTLPCAADANAVPFIVEGAITIYDFSLVTAMKTMNYGVYANGLLVDCSSSVRMMNKAYTLLH